MVPKILSAALGVAAAGSLIAASPALASTPPTTGSHTGSSSSAAGPAAGPKVERPKAAARQTASEYAEGVVLGWVRKDQVVVDILATPTVVKGLADHADLAVPGWAHTSTKVAGTTTLVTFVNRAKGESLVVGVDTKMAENFERHAATSVEFAKAAKPVSAQTADEYARGVVWAWHHKNSELLSMLTTPGVARDLNAHSKLATGDWVQTASRVKNGTTYVTFGNRAEDETLVLGVDTWRAEHRIEHGATSDRFARVVEPMAGSGSAGSTPTR